MPTSDPSNTPQSGRPDPADAGVHMTGALEPRSKWGVPAACPMAKTFDIVGTKTAYVLLREAFYGATRFEEFVQRTGVSEPVAAARLRELVSEGILEKLPYREPGQRTRHEYHLTDKGTDLLPVLTAMMSWGDRWLFEDGARLELTHTGCGEHVDVVMRCSAGHDVAAGELDLALRKRGTLAPPAS